MTHQPDLVDELDATAQALTRELLAAPTPLGMVAASEKHLGKLDDRAQSTVLMTVVGHLVAVLGVVQRDSTSARRTIQQALAVLGEEQNQ